MQGNCELVVIAQKFGKEVIFFMHATSGILILEIEIDSASILL